VRGRSGLRAGETLLKARDSTILKLFLARGRIAAVCRLDVADFRNGEEVTMYKMVQGYLLVQGYLRRRNEGRAALLLKIHPRSCLTAPADEIFTKAVSSDVDRAESPVRGSGESPMP